MNEILIYGEIGTDVKDSKIVDQLSKFSGEPVRVRVNSPGGDVYAGLAIMNALRGHDGEVTAVIEGLAASAASFVAIGGADRVVARPSAEVMIHNAWSMAAGNSDELVKMAGDLKRISDTLANVYAEKAGGDPDTFRDLMRAETWFSAQEALEAGLIDAVEDARQPAPEPAEPAQAKVMASFRYRSRSQAPPPEIVVRRSESPTENTKPSDGQEGEGMNILNQLAQELGREPEEVQKALSGFFNEAVTISGEVDVTYPEGVKVAPTEKVTVRPLIDGAEGEVPAGVTFEVTAVADGFTAEVDEAGVVTITAPSGVEPGDTAEFTVTVNDVAVPLNVEVRAVSGEEDASGEAAPVETAPAPDAVTLDRETYNDLRAAAQLGWKAMEAEKVAKLDAEVDGWVSEGRISAALRAKAIKAIRTNAELARDLYGANPAGTIPRNEIGSGHGLAIDSTVPSADDLRALSESRRKSGK